jgi:hypothetical protein
MASSAAVILSSISLLISSSHLIVKHIKSIKSSCVTCYCGNEVEDNEIVLEENITNICKPDENTFKKININSIQFVD